MDIEQQDIINNSSLMINHNEPSSAIKFQTNVRTGNVNYYLPLYFSATSIVMMIKLSVSYFNRIK